MQRRVEGLLEEYLDRFQLTFGKSRGDMGADSSIQNVEDVGPDENQEFFVDDLVMEKILQRKSSRMRNLQRSWQVHHFPLTAISKLLACFVI